MKKLLFLFRTLAFSALAIFAVSCSSDSSSNNPVTPGDTTKVTGDYFKIATGNYWTYTQYDRDQANAKDLTTKREDSTIITDQSTLLGKTAFKVAAFKGTDPVINYATYVVNNQLFTEITSILPKTTTIPLPISQIANQYIKIADMNATAWDVFSQDFSNIDIPVTSGITGKLTAKYSINVKKSVKSSTTISGVLVETQEFILNNVIKGELIVMGSKIPVDLTLVTHNVYGKNIGMISTWTESNKITATIPIIGAYSLPINGSEAYINKFSVK